MRVSVRSSLWIDFDRFKNPFAAITSGMASQMGGAYRGHRCEEIGIRLSIGAFKAHVLEILLRFGGLSEEYLTSLVQDKGLVKSEKISKCTQGRALETYTS